MTRQYSQNNSVNDRWGVILSLSSILAFLVFWTLYSISSTSSDRIFPNLLEMFFTLKEMIHSGEFLNHLLISLFRILAGLSIGAFLGISIGILTGMNTYLANSLGTIIHLFRPIPIIALVPLVVLWFGIGEFSKITLIIWAVFSIVWVQTHLGIKTIAKSYRWLSQSLQLSRIQEIKHILFPGAIPSIIAALRIAIPVGYIVLIAAELAGSTSGLGFLISTAHLSFRLDRMLIGIITLGVLGALSDSIFFKFIRKQVKWYAYEDNKT